MVKKYSRLKMDGLFLLSILVNLIPLIIVLVVNWGICTKTKREGIAITLTGIVWVLVLIATISNSVPKKVNKIFGLTVAMVLCELMRPLLKYMTLFIGAALIGVILDTIIVKPKINRYKELRLASKTAEITTMQVKEAVKEIISQERSGRV